MPGPRELGFLAMGLFTRVFCFVSEGQPYVLRIAKAPQHVHRGAIAYGYLAGHCPIPAVIKQGTDKQSPEGSIVYWSIQQRCAGHKLTDTFNYGEPFDVPDFIQDLQGLHQAPVPEKHQPNWVNFLAQAWGYDTAEHRGELLDVAFFEALRAEMHTLAADSPSTHWIHGDIKPDNIMIDGGKVSGFIDWETLNTGDFLYDVATFLFYCPAKKQSTMKNLLLSAYTAAGFKMQNLENRLRCYTIHVGLRALWENSVRYQPERYERAVSLLRP